MAASPPHFGQEVQNLQCCEMKGLNLEGNPLIHKIRVMFSRELFETEYSSFCAKDPSQKFENVTRGRPLA